MESQNEKNSMKDRGGDKQEADVKTQRKARGGEDVERSVVGIKKICR